MEKSEAEILQEIMDNRISEINVSMPASIISYDYTKQKAQVKPLLKKIYNDEGYSRPIISNVPVIFPPYIHSPINVGDTVLLIFSQQSLEEWLTKGEEVKPLDNRANDLTDAIAIPFCKSFNQSFIAKNNDDFLIKYQGSEIEIKKDKTINVATDNDCNVSCANLVADCSSNAEINCVSAGITCTGDLSATCLNADIQATTTASVTSPIINLDSGGVGKIQVTAAGTIIDGKNFLIHTHSGVTSGPSNTGVVV